MLKVPDMERLLNINEQNSFNNVRLWTKIETHHNYVIEKTVPDVLITTIIFTATRPSTVINAVLNFIRDLCFRIRRTRNNLQFQFNPVVKRPQLQIFIGGISRRFPNITSKRASVLPPRLFVCVCVRFDGVCVRAFVIRVHLQIHSNNSY